jgi:hypothetical protein
MLGWFKGGSSLGIALEAGKRLRVAGNFFPQELPRCAENIYP